VAEFHVGEHVAGPDRTIRRGRIVNVVILKDLVDVGLERCVAFGRL
jgi:hypothetical protein